MNANLPSHGRFKAAISTFSVVVVLVACGGGGGGGTTTPTTQTVTCPNGTSKTAATLDLATAQCAAPVLVSVSPANASTNVAVDTFTSIDAATDSTLDAGSITNTTVTLKAGTNAVAGTASAVGTKGFKFVPTAKLNYAQAYAFSATVKDTLGKSLVVSTAFATAAIVCTAPLVADANGASCVPPTCTLPAVWDGAACTVPVLHYTDKVYAIWTYANLFAVTKTGVTKVVNKTRYPVLPGNVFSLFNCWLAEKNQADGRILVNCQEAVTNNRHLFYIDPTKDELYEYETQELVWDTTPVGTGVCGWCKIVNYPSGVKWVAVSAFDFVHQWYSQAAVADGWFYTLNPDWVLWFLDSKTGLSSIVKAGTFDADGNILYLNSYTN